MPFGKPEKVGMARPKKTKVETENHAENTPPVTNKPEQTCDDDDRKRNLEKTQNLEVIIV